MEHAYDQDPLWGFVRAEEARQESHLEMIASENHTSEEVLAAMATRLNDKYAEGYPGRRYYGGCEHVDEVESLCRERAKALFGASHANVQAHSGTQANIAALMALVGPGERVLAMSLDHGGHLSHGHPKNFSGQFYEFHSYGVERASERIDLERVRAQARELRPALLLAGASAYSRVIDFAALGAIAREVGARFLVDMAHIAGLVAGGVHPSPVPHADVVTMTTHKTLRGPRGGLILATKDWIKPINSAVFPGGQGGPFLHVIAAKAVALRQAAEPSFRAYAARVVANAARLAEVLGHRGLRIVSGGTDNHLLLVDVSSTGYTGAQAEERLGAVGITVNKNLVPYDIRPPMEASGIRIGTPAVTSRGLGPDEMEQVGVWIADVLNDDRAGIERARKGVAELSAAFPIRAALGARA